MSRIFFIHIIKFKAYKIAIIPSSDAHECFNINKLFLSFQVSWKYFYVRLINFLQLVDARVSFFWSYCFWFGLGKHSRYDLKFYSIISSPADISVKRIIAICSGNRCWNQQRNKNVFFFCEVLIFRTNYRLRYPRGSNKLC